MDSLTRRRFLVASGVTGAAALAAGATWVSLSDVLQTAGVASPDDARTLVVVTLYGGNDGLNTVIPFADPAYMSVRPELAYRPEDVLKLDATTGLNPSMKGLHRYFQAGKLAIVRGVGYPQADRSHFRSMDIWHTAEPKQPGNTGWLGRWLDRSGGDPLLAVSFEQVLPPMLVGASSSGSVVGGDGLRLPHGFGLQNISDLGRGVPGETRAQARAASCLADLVRVDSLMREVREEAAERATIGEGAVATGTGGLNVLDSQLGQVAQCVEAKVATRVFSVSLGGFDTHADEKLSHQALLGMMDRAVSTFLDRMDKTDVGRNLVVLIYSEFGRRVRANASDGTDHGTASDVMVLGHGVHGGIFGEPPNLLDLDEGDLKYTTDFRDVYASVAEQVLYADAGPLLKDWKGRLRGIF